MEQSLAAEKMYFSSEVMTRQVIGSLCPCNTLISEESGATSWRDKREVIVVKNTFPQNIKPRESTVQTKLNTLTSLAISR